MRRKAFTLLEVLTVIAIIAILVTLVTLGVGHMTKRGKSDATRVAMENLKALVAERKIAGGTAALDQIFLSSSWTSAGQPAPVGTPPQGRMIPPGGDAAMLVPEPPVLSNVLTKGTSAIESNSQIGATLLVMNMLKALPNNARVLSGLPANATKVLSAQVQGTGPAVTITAPIMLDGWRQPILYVPPGGLLGVYRTGNDGKPQALTVTAPDGRGFWISAGPDGVFSFGDINNNGTYDAGEPAGGDDNVYSFEN